MSNALIAAQLALQWATMLQQLTALLVRTRAEGREPTDEELNELAGKDDQARAALQAEIDRIRASGG